MRITKFGHSCLSVQDGDAFLLIDPGTFSSGFETLTGLTGILVTHAHADHLDPARIAALLQQNPDATVHADAAAAQELGKAGVTATAVSAGQRLDLGTTVETIGEHHAVIHQDLPRFSNTGFLIGGRLFHPGDSLLPPDRPLEILAVPVMAPWMALKEAIDFERAVSPQVSIPIHDHLLAVKPMFYGRLADMGPDGMRWLDLDDGHTEEW